MILDSKLVIMMELNKDVFFNSINTVIISSQSADEVSCQNALCCFLSQNKFLEQSICFYLKDKETTYEQLCNIAEALIVIYKNTDEDEAKRELCHLILGCYTRAFIIASMKERHRIAYLLCLFINITYYTHYNSSSHMYFYGSHIEEFFSILDINCDKECNQIYRINVYQTSKGLACYQGQRIAKLIQWYILRHLKKAVAIHCDIIKMSPSEIQKEIDECYSHLCNIEERKLSKLAYGYFKYLVNDYTDEGMEWMDANDEYWERRIFVYNKDNKVEFHDIEEEIRREVQEEYDEYLQSQKYDHSNNDIEEYDGYGKYRGSYAQDEMGYSDDDIDTIFDGDPSAYWNID